MQMCSFPAYIVYLTDTCKQTCLTDRHYMDMQWWYIYQRWQEHA